MLINGKSLNKYNGKLLMEYKVSGCELDVSVIKGRHRSSLMLLNSSVGLKNLTLPIVFQGKDRAEASAKKSMFEQEAFGKSELIMDDGLKYSVVLSSIGDADYQGMELLKTDYIFTGIQHGDYIVVQGNTVHCDSTLPYTDCILTATVTIDSSNYKLGTVIFKEVTTGEVLTVDGINGRILVNGVPAAERADWIEFPKLTPGINHIPCNDVLTVEFYPAYF